jgi:hypothetical protein
MIHALEIGLALAVVMAGFVALTPRPRPVPIRVRANRTGRHPRG